MDQAVNKKQIITSLLSVAAVLGGLYLLFWYFGITNVQATIDKAGIWAPLILVLAKASTIIVAPLSGSPLYPLAGALFGFAEGSALLLAGDALGGVGSFYISRIFGRSIVEKMMGGDEKFLGRALRMMGSIRGFVVARICFFALPEVVAYGAGLTRINFFIFFLIYILFDVPIVLVYAGLGSVLTLNSWWVLPLSIVAGIVIIPVGFLFFRNVLLKWEKAE